MDNEKNVFFRKVLLLLKADHGISNIQFLLKYLHIKLALALYGLRNLI